MKIGSDEWSQVIIDGAKVFDLDLDRSHTNLFAAHAGELLHWTKTINLTTIVDPLEVAVKHFVDSLAPARLLTPGAILLDIGSGGGFPGIPLKVVIPSLAITLIDASRKKVNFLKHVIRILGLDGIEALHIRAEELAGDSAYRSHFNIITSRALSDLRSFINRARPLLAVDGQMIALKGNMDQTEIEAVRPHVLSAESYMLPFTGSKRSIINFR